MKKQIIIFIINYARVPLLAVLLITNCISQWVQQTSGVTAPLYNVQFVNRWTGWVTGGNSTILKTTNSGQSWLNQSIDLLYPKNLYGLSMVDENTGYIAGWFETILKTTTSGNNWLIISNRPSNTGNSNNAVSFINAQTGWICSFLGRVLKTTNGGTSWDTLNTGSTGPLRDIQFLNSQTGWLCGDVGNLKKSTDSGNNWLPMPILSMSNLTSLHFINLSTGWVVSEQSKYVFRTTNSGVKWDTVAQIPSGSTEYLYSVYFTNSLMGWIGGSNTRLFKTTNGGFNWVQQLIPTGMFIDNMSFVNDSVGWAVGGPGVIINTTTGGQPIAVKNEGSNVPTGFKLYQNYPNPFNSQTNIKFEIPSFSKGKELTVNIIVYDILGREVETIVYEKLHSGVYSVNFDASGLSSGVYLYCLNLNNVRIDTKKLILSK